MKVSQARRHAARVNGRKNQRRNLRLYQLMLERKCSRQWAYYLLKKEKQNEFQG